MGEISSKSFWGSTFPPKEEHLKPTCFFASTKTAVKLRRFLPIKCHLKHRCFWMFRFVFPLSLPYVDYTSLPQHMSQFVDVFLGRFSTWNASMHPTLPNIILEIFKWVFGFRLKNAHPSRGNILAKRIPGSNSFEKKILPSQTLFCIPSRELTYPPKMAFWRWFSFSQGGYVNSLEGICIPPCCTSILR